MTDEPVFFRQTFHVDGPRDVTIYHDGTSDLYIDGVLFYRMPADRAERDRGIFGRPRGRRVFTPGPIERLRDRWSHFRNGPLVGARKGHRP